jgi:hypothetical protein
MVLNFTQYIVCSSIYWEKYYKKSAYPDLFPQHRPRIVDPANPANNLHETGISGYFTDKKCRDYGDGDGDWAKFVECVDTLDLTVPVEQAEAGVYQQMDGIRF